MTASGTGARFVPRFCPASPIAKETVIMHSAGSFGRLTRALLVGALGLLPSVLAAQSTGRLAGTVRNSDGTGIGGAIVSLVGTAWVATAGTDGGYTIDGIAPGRYVVTIRSIGVQAATRPDVEIRAGQDTRLDVTLERVAIQLGGIVVSASRRPEKITDAPATVSRLDADGLALLPGNGINGALREIKGIDVIQVGIATVAINARGFNSSFNNRMLTMEDGRVAQLSESGLPVGNLGPTPRIDLAGVDVLVGPGAALYGADASNGVVSSETKDPRAFPGSTAELTFGNRSFVDAQVRYAGTSGKWGYKVSGNYLTADDFSNQLNYALGTARTPEIGLDWTARSVRGTGSLVYYSGASKLAFSGGWATTDGVGQTNVGRNQLDNYTYSFLQARFSSPRFYGSVYRNHSGTGNTYAANAYSQNRVLLPASISDDSVRRLSAFPGSGNLIGVDLQHNFTLPALARTHIIWGGQARIDQVQSARRWLTDRLTGEDITVSNVGGYVQTETPFTDQLRMVLAARVDKHEDYDAQFSPKAALLLTPVENNTFRVSYNRAFKSPTILQRHFYFPNFSRLSPTIGIGVFGNREGFSVRNAAGSTTCTGCGTFDALVPETNTTWELGYKGIVADKLYLDVTGFLAKYENFFTPLIIFANPLAGTFAHDAAGNRYRSEEGAEQIFLAYINIGEAKTRGMDMGFRSYFSSAVSAAGTLSLMHLTPVDTAGKRPQIVEATALNTTKTKWNLGVTHADLPGNLFGTVSHRYVAGYDFRSGINIGKIPTFWTTGLSLGWQKPGSVIALTAAVDNLFSCSKGRYTLTPTTPPPGTLDTSSKCGFGEKHMEMVNMPEVGTMVFFGIRYHR